MTSPPSRRRARDLLLTSGRERLKEGPVKDKIINELVRRLANDKRLQELQNEIAARPKTSQEEEETFADVIEEHLKKSGVNFEAVAKRVWALTTQDEVVDVPGGEGGGGKGKQELPPIPSKDPPDMIRWMVKKPEYTMYPGQTYSWTFETNARPSYWDPDDPNAKIRVYGDRFVHFTGAPSTMRGGRVRCSFECSQNATVGMRQAVEVRMVVAAGTSFMSKLDIVVTAKPVGSTHAGGRSTNPGSEPGTKTDGPGKGEGKGGTGPNGAQKEVRPITKHRWVTAQRFLLVPKPINKRDHEPLWQAVSWPDHTGYAGFVTLKEQGKIAIYYNEELPALLEAKRLWDRRNMGEIFLEKYKVRLAMHVVFAYNLDVLIDETQVTEDVRNRVREDRIATAQDLIHAVSSEMETEYKVAKDG